MSNKPKFRYIDAEVEKNVIRDRLSSLEVQIAQAHLSIRLLEDSGVDQESEQMIMQKDNQRKIIVQCNTAISNAERYLKELGGDDESEASHNNRVNRRKAAKTSSNGNGSDAKESAENARLALLDEKDPLHSAS